VDPRTATSPPERTCVGCRKKAPRDQLVRLVRVGSPDGAAPRIRVDAAASAPGRGAWLHPDARCLGLALRRGGLARSFRGPVEVGSPDELARDLEAAHAPLTQKRVEEPMDIR